MSDIQLTSPSEAPIPKPVAKRVLAKLAAVAPSEDLVTVTSTPVPGSAPVKTYVVDPAYFDEHVASAAASGYAAQVVGNAVRIDY
jgi:hypothetical protein